MNRPYYETEEDVRVEKAIAEMVCGIYNYSFIKLKLAYQLDFALLRDGNVEVWLEVKRRQVQFDAYPDIILSLDKYMAGRNLIKHAPGTKFWFVVLFNDGTFLCDLTGKYAEKVNIGGRTDRNDWQDREPVIHIPTRYFKRLI